jgi:5-methylcytosine-specific restriction endonuclease McrA
MAGSDIGPDGSCAQCACGAPLYRRGSRGRFPQKCEPCKVELSRSRSREYQRRLKDGASAYWQRDRLYKARERRMAKARASGAIPFDEFQKARTKASIERRSSVCGSCGVGFVARGLDRLSYCSRQCAGEARKTRPPAHSKVWFPTCRECDRVFATRLKAVRVCSDGCKAAEERQRARARAAALVIPLKLRCPECDSEFVRTYGDKGRAFCSQACSKRHTSRANRKKRKWVERAARVEAVNPFKVFERDGWRCRCCRKPTPRDKRGTYHPRAPELDHIIPLAKGGEHSYRNTQLLCRACNGAKSDTDGGQQMRLFG